MELAPFFALIWPVFEGFCKGRIENELYYNKNEAGFNGLNNGWKQAFVNSITKG